MVTRHPLPALLVRHPVLRGLAVGVLLPVFDARAQNRHHEKEAEIRSALRDIFIRDVDIKGAVVDEDGKSVAGVKMLKVLCDAKGKQYIRETSEDGTFSFEYRDCLGVRLYFTREGYFPSTVNLSTSYPISGTSDNGNPLIRETDLRIKMEAIGPATPMNGYESRPVFTAGATSHAMQVATERDGAVELLRKLRAGVPMDLTKQSADQFPSGLVYVRASCVDGRIPHRSDDLHIGESSYGAKSLAKEAYLGLTGKDSGLILCEPTREDGSTLPEHLLRCLRDAPREGYQKEIPLDRRSMYVFFYCKAGDFHGKGYAGLPRRYSAEGGDRVEAMVWVYMQPDKTRNVRSME